MNTKAKPNAHFYIFSDGCPSDWLNSDHSDSWRVLANYSFQVDPLLKGRIDCGESHEVLLEEDEKYTNFILLLISGLGNYTSLQKWNQSPRYRRLFCQSFIKACTTSKQIISAAIYKAATLRDSQKALLKMYNDKLGGIEGRGINFERFSDSKGRAKMRHEFLNFNGVHIIEFLEDQGLVLLLLAWFVADQYAWRRNELDRQVELGFSGVEFTFISDKLSGDDDIKKPMERCLRLLINPQENLSPIHIVRSKFSDKFSGDLIADNLAGWLREAVSHPNGEFANYIKNSDPSLWIGCHIIEQQFRSRSLNSYLSNFS